MHQHPPQNCDPHHTTYNVPTKENILCKTRVRGNTPRLVSRNQPTTKEQSCRGRNPCEKIQRTIPLAHNARHAKPCEDMQGNDTPCEDVWEPILPRGHAKKRYSLRGRVGTDTRDVSKIRLRQAKLVSHARSHHERYRDESPLLAIQ